MRSLLVTSCTGRKTISASPRLSMLPSREAVDRRGGGLSGLATAWLAEVEATEVCAPAARVYAGRTMVDALASARAVGGRLVVVSAGLGLIEEDEPIPGYALTVANGAESVLPTLQRAKATVDQWWSVLNSARSGNSHPLAALVDVMRPERVLVALPSRYLEMILTDLQHVSSSRREAFRIFTSPAGRDVLPSVWRDCVMPYDERLDGEGSRRRGTRTDFAQRAMRHFVDDLRAAHLSLADARAAVTNALSGLSVPTFPLRRRATDTELLDLLRTHWHFQGGQSSRLLRFLRDDALVQCEQSRFRSLWQQLRGELDSSGAGSA